jgi:hypothetical protein
MQRILLMEAEIENSPINKIKYETNIAQSVK